MLTHLCVSKLTREKSSNPQVSFLEDCMCLDQPRLRWKPFLIGRGQVLIASDWWRAGTCRPWWRCSSSGGGTCAANRAVTLHWRGGVHLHSTHISGADSLHIARHDYFLRAPFLKVYPDKAIPSWVWRKRGWDKERFGGQGMTQNKS